MKRSKTIKSKSNIKSKSKLQIKCRQYLSKKISKNMKEWKQGKYRSRQQALAVSYSQTRKANPKCIKIFN